MKNSKTIIHLFGYSCVGKSSIGDSLKSLLPGLYTIDFDRHKRQLAGYQAVTDANYIKEITVGFFEVVCKTEKPILLIVPPFENEEEYKLYKDIADTYGYSFYSFEVTADRDTLIERYKERLANPANKTSKSLEAFLSTLKEQYFMPLDSTTLDTTSKDAAIIASEVLKFI